jgi:drug/metabolite transporter (DMT)-like permease
MMFDGEVLTVVCGLGSALTWGAADFSGGWASKKGSILPVIFFAEIIGAALLLILAFFVPEPADWGRQFFWGGLAGLSGTCGLAALYRGLAGGRMGVVAPVSAVLTACIPILFTFLTTGPPQNHQIVGFVLGLAAVWLLSSTGKPAAGTAEARPGDFKTELFLSLLAGLGFAGFFICIGHVPDGAYIRPLLGARVAALFFLGLILVRKGQSIFPGPTQRPYAALAGLLDTVSNALFVVAVHKGRLDVAAVLTSMYPAVTVMLAWGFLKERLTPFQWSGFFAALISLVLIAS